LDAAETERTFEAVGFASFADLRMLKPAVVNISTEMTVKIPAVRSDIFWPHESPLMIS
jgi:hypothetical protein